MACNFRSGLRRVVWPRNVRSGAKLKRQGMKSRKLAKRGDFHLGSYYVGRRCSQTLIEFVMRYLPQKKIKIGLFARGGGGWKGVRLTWPGGVGFCFSFLVSVDSAVLLLFCSLWGGGLSNLPYLRCDDPHQGVLGCSFFIVCAAVEISRIYHLGLCSTL